MKEMLLKNEWKEIEKLFVKMALIDPPRSQNTVIFNEVQRRLKIIKKTIERKVWNFIYWDFAELSKDEIDLIRHYKSEIEKTNDVFGQN